MALRAGRVGVAKSQVDRNGNLIIPEIPVATPAKVGGVKPVAKTSSMTRSVGVDSNGALYVDEELPDYGVSDAGKSLVVGEDGSLEWAEKSGGGWVEVEFFLIPNAGLNGSGSSYTIISNTNQDLYFINSEHMYDFYVVAYDNGNTKNLAGSNLFSPVDSSVTIGSVLSSSSSYGTCAYISSETSDGRTHRTYHVDRHGVSYSSSSVCLYSEGIARGGNMKVYGIDYDNLPY